MSPLLVRSCCCQLQRGNECDRNARMSPRRGPRAQREHQEAGCAAAGVPVSSWAFRSLGQRGQSSHYANITEVVRAPARNPGGAHVNSWGTSRSNPSTGGLPGPGRGPRTVLGTCLRGFRLSLTQQFILNSRASRTRSRGPAVGAWVVATTAARLRRGLDHKQVTSQGRRKRSCPSATTPTS